MTETSTTNSTTSNLSNAAFFSADTLAKMNAYLDAAVQVDHFSGSVMVARKGEAVLTRSDDFASREHEVTNTPTTKFRIGSVTKQFTAVAILQLQEKGLLAMSAPIAAYLPDYPKGDRITVHHLLTHTAGIPEYLDPKAFPDLAEWLRLSSSLEQLVNRFKDLPLEFEPGEKFRYSNSGYVLLTQIIETVSQQTYTDYLQANLFSPLGMQNTGYETPQAVIPQLAQGYFFMGEETYLQAGPLDMSIPQGAGGLYSTVEDLNIWNQWLHSENYGDNSSDYEDSAVLSEAAKAMLMIPVVQMEPEANPNVFYGYGLVMDSHLNRRRVHHAGGISGFASFLAYYPEEALTIAVLSNLETAAPARVGEDLAAIAFQAPYEIPKQREAVEIDPAIYQKYVGTYQLLPEMQVTIRVENSELTAQATGQEAFVLYPSSETDFFAKVADITVTFAPAEDGTEGLRLRQMGQELFAPKVE